MLSGEILLAKTTTFQCIESLNLLFFLMIYTLFNNTKIICSIKYYTLSKRKKL